MHSSVFRTLLLFAALLVGACEQDPGYRGRSSGDWINSLQRGADEERAAAAEALGKVLQIRPDFPQVVSALSVAIGDTSDAVRLAAATALSTEGVDPFAALSGLHATLHDSAHASVRASAAYIIGSLGAGRGRPMIRALIEVINDSAAVVREAAIESLGMLNALSESDLEEVVKHSSDSDPSVRRAVFQTLLNLRAPATVTIPPAQRGLTDSSESVRAAAAFTLGALGPAAAPAVPALTKALSDPSELVKTAAAFALGAVGKAAQSSAPALRQLAKSDSRDVARVASEALALVSGTAERRSSEPSTMQKCGVGAVSSERC